LITDITASTFNVLFVLGFSLLLAVTGGIVYLTIVEWRDRRRLDQEKRER
jgi:hypothetical protein